MLLTRLAILLILVVCGLNIVALGKRRTNGSEQLRSADANSDWKKRTSAILRKNWLAVLVLAVLVAIFVFGKH